jgi:TrmH RNA methyltransferase
MVSIGTSLEAKESLSCIGTVCKDTPSIIVLGNEEHGISREVQDACDHLVIIPYTGINANSEGPRMDSLNVAQASAVVMYELSSARSRGVK